jgi:hypothetical protein
MKLRIFILIFLFICANAAFSSTSEIKVGDVRIQLLSPHLIRLEKQGSLGFEDRKTFLVVERSLQEVKFITARKGIAREIQTQFYKVRIPDVCRGIEDIEIRSTKDDILFKYDGLPFKKFTFPAPYEMARAFVLADIPRVVPPMWGATPVPEGAIPSNSLLVKTSGWDFRNAATDIYIFVCEGATYAEMRAEYLKLTGRIPLPPRYVLGFWDSRYYPYTEQEALSVIDRYRKEGIPLDVFVVDTDWRKGGSDGYDIEAKLFPDMRRFLNEAHKRYVKVVFNDHPVAKAKSLDPIEIKFRWDGVTSLLALGLDSWWYDRNWGKIIEGPIQEIDREVWGQRVYYDIFSRFRTGERPLLMSMPSEHPASHRYPIWWTGDIASTYDALREGIIDSIGGGVRLMPWVHQDLGGHTGNPSAELYVRFLEWGCLSPVTRVHCTTGKIRYPWAFGSEAQKIVTEYIKLRYRLLPVLYTAARKTYDDGTPILRRCDFDFPQFEEARDNTQCFLGDDILIAPVSDGNKAQTISSSFLKTPDGKTGLLGEYFANKNLQGKPALIRIDKVVDFDWKGNSPEKGIREDEFSIRWTGKLGPIPATGKYEIAISSDDGIRLWLDGKLALDKWALRVAATDYVEFQFEKGKFYDIKIEYFENTGAAVCMLNWSQPGTNPERSLWLPPGEWENMWTGEVLKGPKTVEAAAPLWLTPMFVRLGAIITLAPQMQYTSEKPWDPVTLEVYPPISGNVVRHLYEDDGFSLGYLKGEFACTWFAVSRNTPKQIDFAISAAKGNFEGQLQKRGWFVRFHLLPNERPSQVWIDGKSISLNTVGIKDATAPYAWIILPSAPIPSSQIPLMPLSGAGSRPPSSAGVIVEIWLPSQSIALTQKISLQLN